MMGKNIFLMFLLLSTPALYAMEAKETEQDDIIQEDRYKCRKLMLKDALQTFLLSGHSIEIIKNDDDDDGLRCQVNGVEERDMHYTIGMYPVGDDKEQSILFTELILESAKDRVSFNTPRGILINKFKKIPGYWLKSANNLLDSLELYKTRLTFNYSYTEGGTIEWVNFNALYTFQEARDALNDILAKQCVEPENQKFTKNVVCIKKLFRWSIFHFTKLGKNSLCS